MIFDHKLALIFVICLPFNALTMFNPPSNLTSFTADADYRCIPKSRRFERNPALTDCLTAIGQLPRIDGADCFHNGPPDDPYKLPVMKTVGTCTVRVEMQHEGSSREAFNWFILVTATARLSRECLTSWLWPDRGVGALIEFGKHGRIIVSVRHYKAVSEGEIAEAA